MSSDLQPVTVAGKTYYQRLARVQSFTLSNEDHGCLTLWLHLDYGGSLQGFGGYTLDTYSDAQKRRVGHACGTDMILRILTVFAVGSLEKVVGRYCYALFESKTYSAPVVGLKTVPQDGDRVFLVEDWKSEYGFTTR